MWNFALYPSFHIQDGNPSLARRKRAPRRRRLGVEGGLYFASDPKNSGKKKKKKKYIYIICTYIYIYRLWNIMEYWFSTMLEFDMTLRTTRMTNRMIWDIQWYYTIKLAEYSRHRAFLKWGIPQDESSIFATDWQVEEEGMSHVVQLEQAQPTNLSMDQRFVKTMDLYWVHP